MSDPTIFIVDDDDAVRHYMAVMCKLAGLASETFAGAADFMAAYRPSRPGCLVVDQRMPGMNGLELLEWMSRQDMPLPVIVMTGHGELPVAVTAFRGGAWDFLEKPFSEDYFLKQVRAALSRDADNRRKAAEQNDAAARYRRLSRRERAVMELMVQGLANKLIAAELGIGIRTVESHRANVLKKMGVTSLSQLTRSHMRLQGDEAFQECPADGHPG